MFAEVLGGPVTPDTLHGDSSAQGRGPGTARLPCTVSSEKGGKLGCCL